MEYTNANIVMIPSFTREPGITSYVSPVITNFNWYKVETRYGIKYANVATMIAKLYASETEPEIVENKKICVITFVMSNDFEGLPFYLFCRKT